MSRNLSSSLSLMLASSLSFFNWFFPVAGLWAYPHQSLPQQIRQNDHLAEVYIWLWESCLLMKSSMASCLSWNKVQRGLLKALLSLVLFCLSASLTLSSATPCWIHFHPFSNLHAFAHTILPSKYCSWSSHGLYCYLQSTAGSHCFIPGINITI